MLTDIAVIVEGAGNLIAFLFLTFVVIPATTRHRLPALSSCMIVVAVWCAVGVIYAAMYANRVWGWPPGIAYDTWIDPVAEATQRGAVASMPVVLLLGSYGLFRDARLTDD